MTGWLFGLAIFLLLLSLAVATHGGNNDKDKW